MTSYPLTSCHQHITDILTPTDLDTTPHPARAAQAQLCCAARAVARASLCCLHCLIVHVTAGQNKPKLPADVPACWPKGFFALCFSEDWALVLQISRKGFSSEHICFLYDGNRATKYILQHFLATHAIENVLASIPCSWTYGSIVYSLATGLQEWAVYGAQNGWSVMQKKQGCAHSYYQRSLAPFQAICRAEACLLCCQPEPVVTCQIITDCSVKALQIDS